MPGTAGKSVALIAIQFGLDLVYRLAHGDFVDLIAVEMKGAGTR